MIFLWKVLKNTPIRAYFFLVYLIFVGVRASKPHSVSIDKSAVRVIIILWLSIDTLLSYKAISVFSFGIWFVGLGIGSFFGVLRNIYKTILVDVKKRELHVPGGWALLSTLLLIFAVKYYLGFKLVTNPDILANTVFVIFAVMVTGLSTGLFIGSFIYYLYLLLQTSKENLKN